jgi:hypothetical protein
MLLLPTDSTTATAAPTARVHTILTQQQYANHDKLATILQQLDMDQMPVASFLVPGASVVESMLIDLGLDEETTKSFVSSCQDVANNNSSK